METQTSYRKTPGAYNPDVLDCLANLSNDEVFTPPRVANQMLDMLPQELFCSSKTTFLDPVSKSGVFLREIVKRLMVGLSEEFPNKYDRLNHIFTHQVYGIAITNLTALISRRSLYCSKKANHQKYSYCSAFGDNEDGHIRFRELEHKFEKGTCIYCGASESVFGRKARGSELESHAYEFIHTDKPEKIYPNVKFDVIIGNPPYQMDDGGNNASASPIYQLFVEQAKKLNPRFLSMIIPARWFGGGKGLDKFRNQTLNDDRFRTIVDFENANDCFPGVDIAGGVCYFLWERDSRGLCKVVNVKNGSRTESLRQLNEFDTFVRSVESVGVIHKVKKFGEDVMSSIVSARKPFGLQTFVRPQEDGDIVLRWQNGEGPYHRSEITVGTDLIDKWKVITSYVGYDHAGNPGKDGKRRVLSRIDILPPGTICTETYLVIGAFNTRIEAENLVGYMKTLFFRFLLSVFMFSHHLTKDTYRLVPLQDFTRPWSDADLYAKYNLSQEEIEFIESMIRPME